jgi:hypothetical protein
MTPPKPNPTQPQQVQNLIQTAQLQQSAAEQRAFELLLIAEQQQTQINAAIVAIEHHNQKIGQTMTSAAEKAAKLAAQQVIEQISTEIKHLNREVSTSRKEISMVTWRHFAFAATGQLIVLIILMMFLMKWTPSLDEIQRRKAEAKHYGAQFSTCDGQTCVRVMRNQCGYGEERDWCVVDAR